MLLDLYRGDWCYWTCTNQTKAMDRTRAPPADYSLNQNCPTMDSRRPKKERPPQGNLEENSREGDEGKGLDMGAVWSVSQLIDTVGGLWLRPYVLPEAQRGLDR